MKQTIIKACVAVLVMFSITQLIEPVPHYEKTYVQPEWYMNKTPIVIIEVPVREQKIIEEGVKFQSHLDGSYHFFTPERAIDIQRSIGADIIMAFDECTPYPCEYNYAKRSMDMTHRWLKRCFEAMDATEPKYGYEQALFPIVQGSVFKDLRKESAETIASWDAVGNAIGGLSVGEPDEDLYEMTELVCDILPVDKPR